MNKFLKETLWSFLSKIVAFFLFVLLNIFLARYLGPEKFGTWSYFYSIISILLLFSFFGLNASTRKFAAQYNQTPNLGVVLKFSLKLRISLSLLFSLLLLILYKPLANWLDRPDFENLFLAAIPVIFFAGLVEYFKCIFQGIHRLKYLFLLTMCEFGLKLIFTCIALYLITDIISIVFSFSVALMVAAILGFFLFYFVYASQEHIFGQSSLGLEILKYSFPLFFVSIGFAIATELDTVMIGLLSNDPEVGVYAAAKQIIIKLPHIALAISLGTMPVFAKLDSSNMNELKKLFYKLLRINSIVFGLISVFILSASWFFMPFIYGEPYRDSVIIINILTVYLVIFSFSIFLSSFLDYQGKAKKRAVNLSVSMLINILLNILLIPKYGATGAAIATSIAYAPYVVLNWLEVKAVFHKQKALVSLS